MTEEMVEAGSSSSETAELNGQTLTKVKGRKKKAETEEKVEARGKKGKKGKKADADVETRTDEGGDEIEHVQLSEEDKTRLRTEVKERRDAIEHSYFDFSDAVYRVYDAAAYMDWSGPVSVEDEDGETKTEVRQYKNFGEYVENELGISQRTADYFVSISRWFGIDLKGNPDVKEKVQKLGWSKAKELVGVVTADNVDEWVEKAERMTVSQLAAACRAALNPDDEKGDESKVKRRSFTLVDDQIGVVDSALEHAGQVANSDKEGYLLTLICTDYLASAVRAPTGKSQQSAYLKRMETILGLKLIAVDSEAKEVVFGKGVYAALTKE